MAWKFVPKSSANPVAAVAPSLSEISLALNPAEKRSEKFWLYVAARNVSATEYVSPVPSGFSSVYTGCSLKPKLPADSPIARAPPPMGRASPTHVYRVAAT